MSGEQHKDTTHLPTSNARTLLQRGLHLSDLCQKQLERLKLAKAAIAALLRQAFAVGQPNTEFAHELLHTMIGQCVQPVAAADARDATKSTAIHFGASG